MICIPNCRLQNCNLWMTIHSSRIPPLCIWCSRFTRLPYIYSSLFLHVYSIGVTLKVSNPSSQQSLPLFFPMKLQSQTCSHKWSWRFSVQQLSNPRGGTCWVNGYNGTSFYLSLVDWNYDGCWLLREGVMSFSIYWIRPTIHFCNHFQDNKDASGENNLIGQILVWGFYIIYLLKNGLLCLRPKKKKGYCVNKEPKVW